MAVSLSIHKLCHPTNTARTARTPEANLSTIHVRIRIQSTTHSLSNSRLRVWRFGSKSVMSTVTPSTVTESVLAVPLSTFRSLLLALRISSCSALLREELVVEPVEWSRGSCLRLLLLVLLVLRAREEGEPSKQEHSRGKRGKRLNRCENCLVRSLRRRDLRRRSRLRRRLFRGSLARGRLLVVVGQTFARSPKREEAD